MTIIAAATYVSCFAQKQGNIWYFGTKAGVDFNSCAPSPLLDGQMPSSEGCATICDTSGQLLFYTNSDTIWNKVHAPMSNGDLVQAGGSLSQVIIVPNPFAQNIYYVVTTQIQGQSPLSLQYHMVDLSLNGGLGTVTDKNNILTTVTVTEQIAATYHKNGKDIWLTVHEYGTNNFLSFLVTSSGIDTTPVISNAGPAIIPCSSGMNARGEIKFSPDGKRMAINNNGIGNDPNSDYLCLFDFDNSTGIVSNPINLPYERGGFGLSFSPDNSKLYAATWKAFNFSASDSNKIYQFDISSSDSVAIAGSKTILESVALTAGMPYGSLKLGPDGKIYVARSGSGYLGVIQSPNKPGALCNYSAQGFYLGGLTVAKGLNNYIEYEAYCQDVGIIEFDKSKHPHQSAPYPNPAINDVTRIDFTLPDGATEGEILFYDLQGREVKRFRVDRSFDHLLISTADLPSGTYYYRLHAAGQASGGRKMVVVR